jgi:type I restriction enzyme S subunit
MPDTARCNLLASLDGHLEKLREAILDMAIRGALVLEGRPGPGPADPDGDPFSLPVGWKWVFAENIFSSIADGDHQPPPKSDDGVPFLVIGNVCKGVLDFAETRFVSPAYFSRLLDSRRPQRGDLLYTVVGSFGIPVVVDSKQPFCVQRHIAILRPSESLDVRYAAHLFRSPFVYGQANTCATGTAQKTVSLGTLRKFRLPLPPLAEQKRIVAKVDQLMALCDDLEAKQTKKRALATQSTHSALTALAAAERGAELSLAWQRLASSFQTLVSTPDDVRNLRGAVAELATRGLLTAQSEKERPAAQLTAKLDAARVGDTDTLPPLPSNWLWARLADLLAFGPKNGYSPKAVEYPTDVKALTLSATTSGRFAPQYFKYIDEKIPKDSDLWLRDGDVLIQRGNTLDYVGIAAVYRGRDAVFIYPDLMIKIRAADFVDVDFLHLALNARPTRDYFKAHASGTSGTMPKINQSVLLETPIPVPPLAEQKRIVAKVDHLMSLLDDLEAKLRKQEETATRLAESLAAAVAA